MDLSDNIPGMNLSLEQLFFLVINFSSCRSIIHDKDRFQPRSIIFLLNNFSSFCRMFQHIHREIQTINKTLDLVGSAECKIGSVSTAVLSKISTNKHEHIANIG